MQVYNWNEALTPEEIRAQISTKRTALQELQDGIKDAKENARDALQDGDHKFCEYWQGQARKLQDKATALESDLQALTIQLAGA